MRWTSPDSRVVPVGGRDQQRQGVQLPGPGNGDFGAVDRGVTIAIDLEVADALVVDQAADHRPHLFQPGSTAFADQVTEFPPGRPDLAAGIDEFVVSGPHPEPGCCPLSSTRSGSRGRPDSRRPGYPGQRRVVRGRSRRPMTTRSTSRSQLCSTATTGHGPGRIRTGDPLSPAAQYAPGADRECPARRCRWIAGPASPADRRGRSAPG